MVQLTYIYCMLLPTPDVFPFLWRSGDVVWGGGNEANNPNGWGYSPGGEYKINDGPLVDMSGILGRDAILRQCNNASIKCFLPIA